MKTTSPVLTIDPAWFRPDAVGSDILAFNENLEKLMEEEPPVDCVPAETSRRIREEGTPRTGPVVLSPRASERSISGPRGDIPLRVFLPQEIRGVYLHIHGGGWVLGSAHLQDTYLENLAKRTKCAVLSVEYRLAPEYPHPAAPDDCEAAAQWLIENAQREYGVSRFIIGGESAGAQLAAVTLLRLKKARSADTGFAGANFAYGVFDLTGTPSMRNWGSRRLVLNTPVMQWFVNQFAPPEILRDPDLSPLYASAADLAGLPPALFTVGTLDLLLDDSLFMAAKWAAAGNQAELAVYPGAVHGFIMMNYSLAKKANARAETFMNTCFGG
jgi:acetyl esterase/lipase